MELQPYKMPTLQELFKEPEQAIQTDQLNVLLNQEPPANWIKLHPFIKNYRYIPIDKIEFLLKRIFKSYSIEILREGQSFNGVYVVVRVHYLNPITNEMNFHDGIGAAQLQVKSGSSPSDLANINNGALSMAFPLAKTVAIKDACDHFGKSFGSDLNRKDTIGFGSDEKLVSVVKSRLIKLINNAKNQNELDKLKEHLTEDLQDLFMTKWNSFE